jgi:hypothetical protein
VALTQRDIHMPSDNVACTACKMLTVSSHGHQSSIDPTLILPGALALRRNGDSA